MPEKIPFLHWLVFVITPLGAPEHFHQLHQMVSDPVQFILRRGKKITKMEVINSGSNNKKKMHVEVLHANRLNGVHEIKGISFWASPHCCESPYCTDVQPECGRPLPDPSGLQHEEVSNHRSL